MNRHTWSAIGVVVLHLLALAAVVAIARAGTKTLTWTNPRFNAAYQDSGIVCEAQGDTLRDLNAVEVWGQPVSGGGWRKVAERGAMGREGAADSVSVDVTWGWHFYLVPRDNSGNRGCASPVVFLCGPCVISSVDLPPSEPPAKVEWFDVQGRKIQEPHRSGVYFRRTGKVVKKIVIVN